jgi:hypothetical protein
LFGYFIGLSVLRPGMAVLLIPLGWLSAAALHGAWDATNDLVDSALIGAHSRGGRRTKLCAACRCDFQSTRYFANFC